MHASSYRMCIYIYMQFKNYGYQTSTRSSDLGIFVSCSFHLRFPAPKPPWLSCFRGMGPCPKPLPALWRRGPKRGDIQRSHQRFGEGFFSETWGDWSPEKRWDSTYIYIYYIQYITFLYAILYYNIIYYIILYWIYYMVSLLYIQ